MSQLSGILSSINANILRRLNQDTIHSHPFYNELSDAFSYLQQVQILNQANLDALVASRNPPAMSEAFSILHAQTNLLTQDNFNALLSHPKPGVIVLGLSILQKARLLTQDNLSALLMHGEPYSLVRSLSDLQQNETLNQENLDVLVAYSFPSFVVLSLSNLQFAGLSTPQNRAALLSYKKYGINFGRAFGALRQVGLLNQANFDVLLACHEIDFVSSAISQLLQAGLLNQDNFNYLVNLPNKVILEFSSALCRLRICNLLNQDNFTILVTHPYAHSLAVIIYRLFDERLLNQNVFLMVSSHESPVQIYNLISGLNEARILTPENQNALMLPSHAILLSLEVHQEIWSRIPLHLFTQANFQRLLTAAEQPNPMRELRRVRDEMLAPVRADTQIPVINRQQSTHTASVHRSVSDSARRLWALYGSQLNLETQIDAIKTYVNGLSDTPEHQVAQRCIERITAPDYAFIDSSSNVSTQQLLALAFVAIHDKEKCKDKSGHPVDIADALNLFVHGLYEIQRGYNLNEKGEDMGGADARICLAGTFNKLMEKLNGIHQDVEVIYITHEGAMAKFPIIARQKALDYLKSIQSLESPSNYQDVVNILNKIRESESLEPIWNDIQKAVAQELWAEFSEAYGHNQEDGRFKATVSSCEGIDIPDFSALLAPSSKPSQHGLWANRQASSEAQHEFDKQYGLTIV